MEPVEVNAGGWYLRALRNDERVNDEPALAAGGIDDPDYVANRTRQWADESHFSWAVCQPNTGELLAEIGVTPDGNGGADLTGWAREGHEEALATGSDAVRRFVTGGLGLELR